MTRKRILILSATTVAKTGIAVAVNFVLFRVIWQRNEEIRPRKILTPARIEADHSVFLKTPRTSKNESCVDFWSQYWSVFFNFWTKSHQYRRMFSRHRGLVSEMASCEAVRTEFKLLKFDCEPFLNRYGKQSRNSQMTMGIWKLPVTKINSTKAHIPFYITRRVMFSCLQMKIFTRRMKWDQKVCSKYLPVPQVSQNRICSNLLWANFSRWSREWLHIHFRSTIKAPIIKKISFFNFKMRRWVWRVVASWTPRCKRILLLNCIGTRTSIRQTWF